MLSTSRCNGSALLMCFGKMVRPAPRRLWIACRPGFFLPVRVLSRLFRRLFLEKLTAAHEAGLLHFFGDHAHLHDTPAFAAYFAPRAKANGSSTASAPSAGPKLCWPICRATPIASPSPKLG